MNENKARMAEHPKKGHKLGEFRSSRSFREAQGNPPTVDKIIKSLFFWFVFFGHAKTINIP